MPPRPTIGTDEAKLFELSSIFQPFMSTAPLPTLVTYTRARVGADLLPALGIGAKPEVAERRDGASRAGRGRGLDEDDRLAGGNRGDAAQRNGAGNGVRVVVHLPTAEVDGGRARIGH